MILWKLFAYNKSPIRQPANMYSLNVGRENMTEMKRYPTVKSRKKKISVAKFTHRERKG